MKALVSSTQVLSGLSEPEFAVLDGEAPLQCAMAG